MIIPRAEWDARYAHALTIADEYAVRMGQRITDQAGALLAEYELRLSRGADPEALRKEFMARMPKIGSGIVPTPDTRRAEGR